MTRVDVLLIDDVHSNAFVVLAHGDFVHVRIETTRMYRWLKISIKSERLYKMFSRTLRKMGETLNIMYRTYAGETSLSNVPKLLRQMKDNDWRHFSLRLTEV